MEGILSVSVFTAIKEYEEVWKNNFDRISCAKSLRIIWNCESWKKQARLPKTVMVSPTVVMQPALKSNLNGL